MAENQGHQYDRLHPFVTFLSVSFTELGPNSLEPVSGAASGKQPLMRMRPWLCVLYVSMYITLNLSTAKYNPFFSPTSIEDQTQQENQNLDIE